MPKVSCVQKGGRSSASYVNDSSEWKIKTEFCRTKLHLLQKRLVKNTSSSFSPSSNVFYSAHLFVFLFLFCVLHPAVHSICPLSPPSHLCLFFYVSPSLPSIAVPPFTVPSSTPLVHASPFLLGHTPFSFSSLFLSCC